MARKLYKKIDGEYRWIDLDEPSPEPSLFVQGDTFEQPLKHPVSGKMFDSKSEYLKETKRLGLEIVGNDKFSQRPRNIKDKISEERILDAIQHAEAIQSDPARRNEQRYKNEQILERAEKLLYAQKR